MSKSKKESQGLDNIDMVMTFKDGHKVNAFAKTSGKNLDIYYKDTEGNQGAQITEEQADEVGAVFLSISKAMNMLSKENTKGNYAVDMKNHMDKPEEIEYK